MQKQTKNGVPLSGGTPVFFNVLFLLACSWIGWPSQLWAATPQAVGTTTSAVSVPIAAGSNTATAQNKVIAMADVLIYHEETGEMSAEGHVRIWYGDLTMTAQTAQADVENRTVHAQGDVTLTEAGKEIRCAKLEYDLNNGTAKAHGILFATHPWYYQGKSVEKHGEKDVTITEPLFSTCNCRYPHYHLKAQRIEIILGESLTAYHTVLYVGATPLFYFPWVWRSIRDNRPPFSIRVGYNSTDGVYVKTKFNYFFRDGNYGSLLLDFLDKKGVGTGVDHKFRYEALGKGEGQLTAYYIKDKSVTNAKGEKETQERINANLSHRHEFDAHDTLQTSLEFMKTRDFNQDFSSNSLDTFQQKSYVSFARRMDAYYASILAQDTESIDVYRNEYYPSQRQLPGVNFGISPIMVWSGKPPVYFSFATNMVREYQRLNIEAGGTTAGVYAFRFRDSVDITPSLTQTFNAPRRILTQPGLSASLSLPINTYWKERVIEEFIPDRYEPSGRVDASYGTGLSLTNKWVDYQRSTPTHLMQSRLTHSFSRRLAHLDEPQRESGVTSNNILLGLEYFAGSDFSIQSSNTYNLMSIAPDTLTQEEHNGDYRYHLDPFTLTGRAMLAKTLNLNWQGQYNWLKGRVTSGYLSGSTFGKGWNAAVNTSYSYLEGGVTGSLQNMIYSTFSGSYALTPQTNLQSTVQYNFSKGRITSMSVSMSRDLHCWEMQMGYTHYFAQSDNDVDRNEIGFSINPKAFPQFKVGGGPTGGAGTGMSMGN